MVLQILTLLAEPIHLWKHLKTSNLINVSLLYHVGREVYNAESVDVIEFRW